MKSPDFHALKVLDRTVDLEKGAALTLCGRANWQQLQDTQEFLPEH
jgi:hypothetical protein